METDSRESAGQLVDYDGWASRITGDKVAIELAAASMDFVMAMEELGLRRRILMELIRGGSERDMLEKEVEEVMRVG